MHNGKVWITDWHGNRHEMTPEDLLERIKNDSKSNWNWLAPATEIVKTISDPEFPEPVANKLKGIILKCFAELLLTNVYGHEESTCQLAVAYCYYSVHGRAEKRIKRLYRENLLKSVIMYSHGASPYGACSKEWRTFCSKWKKDALQCFTKRFGVDFMRFKANAEADYEKSIQAADKAGAFENDKAAYDKMKKEIAQIIVNSQV